VDYHSSVPLTTAEARRWLSGFEAAEKADREARRRAGPDPEWAIGASLSLLEAAITASKGRLPFDPQRACREEAVRSVWERLRARRLR